MSASPAPAAGQRGVLSWLRKAWRPTAADPRSLHFLLPDGAAVRHRHRSQGHADHPLSGIRISLQLRGPVLGLNGFVLWAVVILGRGLCRACVSPPSPARPPTAALPPDWARPLLYLVLLGRGDLVSAPHLLRRPAVAGQRRRDLRAARARPERRRGLRRPARPRLHRVLRHRRLPTAYFTSKRPFRARAVHLNPFLIFPIAVVIARAGRRDPRRADPAAARRLPRHRDPGLR